MTLETRSWLKFLGAIVATKFLESVAGVVRREYKVIGNDNGNGRVTRK
jgi:hypothetical protein